jgi:hypothetical protein
MNIYTQGEEKRLINLQMQNTVDYIRKNVFPIHGIY